MTGVRVGQTIAVATRGLCAAMLILAVLCNGSGCASDKVNAPDARWVSDVGTLMAMNQFSDGTISTYTYENVAYRGDILLSEVRDAVSLVEPEFAEVEVLTAVYNFRVFPASQLSVFTPGDAFLMITCTAESTADCLRGMYYRFKVVEGRVVLDWQESWDHTGQDT